ncbi:MAG: hypothetical protein WBV82_10550, partial [Myxococcaceae bacterium]
LTAWLSIGRPAPDFAAVHSAAADTPAWLPSAELLAATADDHRIKLAWTALDESRHRRWPGYARVLETIR